METENMLAQDTAEAGYRRQLGMGGAVGNAALAQRQRTLSGIGAASSRASGLRVRLQEMLDRVSPVPRAVSGQEVGKAVNPVVPSYAHSLSRLQDELAEISQILDDLESHI